eukprot:scaffold197_cov268-Chaetoceros_neogracile.AAC.7
MEKNHSPIGTDEKRPDLGPLSEIIEIQKNYATKNGHEINPHSSKPSLATPCIKALKRDNIRRDGCDHWLFFDDWKIDATEVKEDPAEYFNCTDYDPVDHKLMTSMDRKRNLTIQYGKEEDVQSI